MIRRKGNSIRVVLTGCCLVVNSVLIAFTSLDKSPSTKHLLNQEVKGFAVLELFTSEGCSSCPPADDLMAKFQKESNGKAIYILAYHVDYWNRLGWKDIYSNAEYSARQEQYGRWLNVSPIYTPQVVINGRFQFTGSDETAIRHEISDQLNEKSPATLDLQVSQHNDKLSFQYQTSRSTSECIIEIAIVQKSAQSKVTRGENAGHTLSHVQIVRKFQAWSLEPGGSGKDNIEFPVGVDRKSCEVFGLIQNKKSGEILAVASVNLE